jgi:hypothetical protein
VKCFIWFEAEETTSSYHAEAGVVIFAESLEQARQKAMRLIEPEKEAMQSGKAWRTKMNSSSSIFTKDPDVTLDQGSFDGVYVFPDAGCC